MVAFVFVRPPRCRHGFARSRHALMTPTASGLMTARPPRQRRSSSESPRERKMGSAIVCGMGRCRATTAEVHNHRQRMSESDTRSGCPVVRRCPALEFRRAFRCRGYCLPPTPRVAAARTFPCVRVCSNGLQLSVRGRGVKRLTDRPTNQRRSSVSSRPDPIPRVRESKMKRIPPAALELYPPLSHEPPAAPPPRARPPPCVGPRCGSPQLSSAPVGSNCEVTVGRIRNGNQESISLGPC